MTDFVLDIWREASRFLDLPRCVDGVARAAASRLPLERMIVRRFDGDQRSIDVLAAGPGAYDAVWPLPHVDCTPDQLRELQAWCATGVLLRSSSHDGLGLLVAGPDAPGEWIAGPLIHEGQPIGLLLLLAKPEAAFAAADEELIRALLELVSVALANHQRVRGQAAERAADGREAPAPAEIVPLDVAMTAHIELALRATGGCIEGPRGAAAILRINPHTLRARMRKLGINWARFRDRRSGARPETLSA
jgi:transcriptional regulator with GAF, ATPase, and Fis domain